MTGATDGAERIFAFRQIPDLAVIVVFTHRVEEILTPWRRDIAAMAAGVAGALVALSLLLGIALRQIRRRMADQVRLRNAEEQYRSLVELAPIGIARHERGATFWFTLP